MPQLDELTLVIDERSHNLDYLTKSLSELHHLRKLELDFRFREDKVTSPRNYEIDKFGKVLAANPDLTHLKLKNSGTGDNANLARMFSYIPADRPLRLEHISLSGLFFGEEAIAPHIRSLASFHLSHGVYLQVLLAEGIFPPIMSMDYIGPDSIEYFDRHPRITSLSLTRGCQGVPIFDIIARHSATLTSLSIFAWNFYSLLDRPQSEAVLPQCTNLQELVFYYHPKTSFFDSIINDGLTPEMVGT